MVIYLIQNDIYGAKYLWKRTPSHLKNDSASEFNRVWAISKSLIQNSLSEAYELIKSQPWSPTLSPLIQRLRERLRQSSLELIRIGYKTLKLSEMMVLLDLTPSECHEGRLHLFPSIPHPLKFVSMSQ
jgi:hypothetical protein